MGDAVTVVLPDGTRTRGTVTSRSTVATRQPGQEAAFETVVELDDPSVAGDLDAAPVEIDVVTEERSSVLTVPVTALVALLEGGYAVERVLDDGTTALAPVDPGLFAAGRVEVGSDLLRVGDRVVVP